MNHLLNTFGKTTAARPSALVNGRVSQDQVTQFLADKENTSKELWQEVKTTVREVKSEDIVLLFDYTIYEKPYTDQNVVMCWHYDHNNGRAVQGFNLLNSLYLIDDISIREVFELI